MFRNLRPHKRHESAPSSPAEQSHSFEPFDHGYPLRWQHAGSPESVTMASPPLLPAIQRVTSAGPETEKATAKTYEWETRPQNRETARKGNTQPRDTYGYSNHQRISLRPESAGNAAPSGYTSSNFTKTPAKTFDSILSQTKFEGPQKLAGSAEIQERGRGTGRRPTGTRLPTPPPTDKSTFEPVQQKSGKTRKLLNPMSLLARRRTSTAVSQLSLESLAQHPKQKLSYDPNLTIQGKFHDFDKPTRSKRNVSYREVQPAEDAASNANKLRSPNAQQESDHDATSPWSGGNHTPVFTENFDEEQYPAAGPHVRKASDLTDLPLPAPPYACGASRSIELKGMEVSQKEYQLSLRKLDTQNPIPTAPDRAPPPVPPKSPELTLQKRISIDPATTPPKSSSSKKERPRNSSDVPVKDGIPVPKHMKSTSSRFSFDMIGAAEQERLLEDRHRQRALDRKAEGIAGNEGSEDEDDEFDYDAMMRDDGLEERIPGVNADLEDDLEDYKEPILDINADCERGAEEDLPQNNNDLGGFTFRQTLLTPLSPQSPAMAVTPRDAEGKVIGFAMTKNSPHLPTAMHPIMTVSPISDRFDQDSILGGKAQSLGLQGCETAKEAPLPEPRPLSDFPKSSKIVKDDLYFDDGIITGPLDDGAVEFDESVFDDIDTDKYGRPINHCSTFPTLYPPPVIAPDPSPPLGKIDEHSEAKATTSIISPAFPLSGSGLAPKSSISEHPSTTIPSHGLTENSLAAYQSALAAAAFTAAAAGKFRRNSATTLSEPEGPGLVSDSGHNSQYEPFSPAYNFEEDGEELEDDAIIAAANAEALAHDDDGFYGQEFGFYSAPASSVQGAEYVNGGYFGPRGIEGLNRSTSGRNREPNLTPITERSEYSNRNSFMNLSLNLHGGPGSVTSPGLAQLAGMMSSPDFDGAGDMSLGNLMKLRRGAWGGSQASLHSSNGSRNGEDMSPVAPSQAQATRSTGAHRRKNSAFSIGESEEAGSPPGSPTLTMCLNTQTIEPLLSKECTGVTVTGSGVQGQAHTQGQDAYKKHKKTSSTESVSYVKEDGERWILERRRTGEDGGIEVFGREIVIGGRI